MIDDKLLTNSSHVLTIHKYKSHYFYIPTMEGWESIIPMGIKIIVILGYINVSLKQIPHRVI